MNLHKLVLMLVLCGSFSSTLFAGTERGSRLIAEGGGAAAISAVEIGIPVIPGAPGLLDFSDFFALMPGDNADTVGGGEAVDFPKNGPTSGVIFRTSASTFLLPVIGTYLVLFQVSADEGGQLMLRLNGVEVADSVVGRATGTTQFTGLSLITTTTPNSILEVINPSGQTPALTITPFAGSSGTRPVSAHLLIVRIR